MALGTDDADSPRGVCLGDLLEELPDHLLEVATSPRGLDVPVTGPCIQDPLEHVAIADGEVVLAVGMAPGTADSLVLIREAAARDASAVVFRTDEEIPSVTIGVAKKAGVAVLTAPSSVTWSRMNGLIRILCLSDGFSRSEFDEYGVPEGDLFGLADTVATMAQGAVTIEDLQSRVIAYSNTGEPIDEQRRIAILGRRLPQRNIELLRSAGVFRDLWQTRDVVHVGDVGIDGEMRPRLAIGVFAGDEPLGSIWVAEGDTPLGEPARNALRRAARAASAHLIKSRHAGDMSRRQRSDVLRKLLDGQRPLESLTHSMGLDSRGQFSVIAIESEHDRDMNLAVRSERVLNLVGIYYQALGRKSAETVIGRTVYVLVPLSRRQEESEHELLAQLTRGALNNLNFGVTVAAGRPVIGLADVASSRQDADLVLRCLHTETERRSATLDDVAPQALFLQLADYAKAGRIAIPDGLRKLAEIDARKGGDNIRTLHAYLRHRGRYETAAAELGVHANTLRYRLPRIQEVLDTDLADPDSRLAIELVLRLGVVHSEVATAGGPA